MWNINGLYGLTGIELRGIIDVMNPLKRIRTRILQVTQVQMAETLGTTQVRVSKMEKTDGDPKLSTLRRILKAYPSLDPAEFFKDGVEGDDDGEKVVLDEDVTTGGGSGSGGKTPNRDATAVTY